MRYAARLSTLKPKTQERVEAGTLRLPSLDAVSPDPSGRGTGKFSLAAQFYIDAWEFVSLWRPAGSGFGIGKARLADLEIFMNEAGLPVEERSLTRRLVGRMESAYVDEMSAQATGGKSGGPSGKEAIEEWRQKHSNSSSS